MKKFVLLILFCIIINIVNAQSFSISKNNCNINFNNISNSKIWYSYDLYQAVITYNPALDVNQFIISDNLRSNTFNINQIINFASINIIIDSFYSWKTQCINFHKGSGGTIDTSNIVYTGTNASLKSLTITGVNSNGHIHLRHQNIYPSSTGQSTTVFADSNGNMSWKNDGLYYSILNTSYQTANRTFRFQNKSYTLADSATVYTKLTSTDTASLSNRINAISNVVQNTTDGATVTGTINNTISMIDSIPANTVKVGDILELNLGGAFVGTNGGRTIRIYFNTIASLSGATQIAVFSPGSTVISLNMKRIIAIKSATSSMVAPSGGSSITSDATNTLALSTLNISWTSKQYIIVAIQLANSADSGYCPYLILKK